MARRDPLLYSRKHRDHNRRYWQMLRVPCAKCRQPIDYDGPQRLRTGQMNPRYLVVGHVVSRTEALQRGWSAAQINDINNTQPECWECSITGGGEENARRFQPSPVRSIGPYAPEASRW